MTTEIHMRPLDGNARPGPGSNAPLGASHGRQPLPRSIKIGWGAGTLAVAALLNAVNVMLLRYLVDYVGMGAAIAGTLIAISKIYDAVIDPLVGTLSDRWMSPHGRRRPFILIGGALLAVAALLLFNVPHVFGGKPLIGYVLFCLIVYATGYAAFCVPYMAMPAEMTSDYHERSDLISYRVYASAIASMLASFVGPILIVRAGGGQAGHTALSVFLVAIILISSVYSFRATRKAPFHPASLPERSSFAQRCALIWSNRPFLLLMGIKLCQLTALAVTQAAMPFLFKRVLHLSDTMLGLYFLVFYASMILFQPAWLSLSRRYGKSRLFLWVTLAYGLMYLSWLFTQSDHPLTFLFMRALGLGATAGGVLLMGQSLLPDTMEWDYRQTGQRREGVLAGLYTVVEKLAYALGAATTGIWLAHAGYIQAAAGKAVEQPASAVTAIYMLGSVVPMVLLFISCGLLNFYDLSESALSDQPAD
jgi:GPH family glycoside/pentoside/hexuronide:cation symporter